MVLLLQDDMRLHEADWSAEEVTRRRTAVERWPEDPFEAVFQLELENQKRLTQPDYLFYLNRDFHDLKPASDKPVSYTHLDVYKRQRLEGSYRETLQNAFLLEGYACLLYTSQASRCWSIMMPQRRQYHIMDERCLPSSNL